MAGTSTTPLTSSRKMGKATREAFGQALAKLGLCPLVAAEVPEPDARSPHRL